MNRFLAALMVLSIGTIAYAEGPATIVVGGNRLTVDSLEVVDSLAFVKDIQVWPTIRRPSAERDSMQRRLLHDSAPVLTASMHDANMAARAKERLLYSLGYGPKAMADSVAAFYRSCTALVKDATVDSQTGQVWIQWSAGKKEEWLRDNNLGATSPRVDSTVGVVNLWRQLLARGCTIYVGDGYEFYVPARRASVQTSLKQTLLNRRLTKVNNGQVADDGIENLESTESEVLRDLQFPQPLDSLRTRR